MSMPLRQSLTVARYLLRQRLRGNDKFPLLVELSTQPISCAVGCRSKTPSGPSKNAGRRWCRSPAANH
jgi:hypothetical protein